MTTRPGSISTGSFGAGLAELPLVLYRDPSSVLLADPTVPERQRFCARCGAPVARSARDLEGECPVCGSPYSFTPQLAPGELVAGQYDVSGCLAHGGMGWVYLARDRNVSERWVVLKGLLGSDDPAAVAAALAERRFLAEVEHPAIVKIHNFVEHKGQGYIVMEFVSGRSLRQILQDRREANGGEPDPLPLAEAISYAIRMLVPLDHLHGSGLVFCDFKLENVIQTQGHLKLIDLGGVRRIGDPANAVFGTTGYQAPELELGGLPSISSDLYTVGRALAMLAVHFPGYQGEYRDRLPSRTSVEPFTHHDSFYRLLLRATAGDPSERFQSAGEFAGQLYGVLREVTAAGGGKPIMAPSVLFTDPVNAGAFAPDWRTLPRPLVDSDDAAAAYLATVTASSPERALAQLRAAPEQTVEVRLRIAASLIDLADWDGAEQLLAAIAVEDRRDWRTAWYRGMAAMARERPADARAGFLIVYRAIPGELAPKLALGVACELSAGFAEAGQWYEIVSRTDPGLVTATFGLARCRATTGDRAGAIEAYDRVPETSNMHLEAQIAQIRCITSDQVAGDPTAPELVEAAARLDVLPVESEQRMRLSAEVFETGLRLVRDGMSAPPQGASLLGHEFRDEPIRLALERTYRSMAKHAEDRSERIRLVDRANQVRPLTWR